MAFNYPTVRRSDVEEDYHGTKVADPYRWLEDVDSEETKKFVTDQNEATLPFLKACPNRDEIHKKLTELWDYPKTSCPFKRGDRYFCFLNSGLQNQSVLYVQDSLDGEQRVFFDPNTLSEDGTESISTYSFSKDGEIFAYGLSSSGSDWSSIHFLDVSTGKKWDEVLKRVKFSGISWTHDNKGIFYCQYPEQEGKTDGSETTANENQKLYYHVLGTDQSVDLLKVDFPDNSRWRIGAEVSDCGNFLIVCPIQDCRDNLVYYAPLQDVANNSEKLKLVPVIENFEADYQYITNNGLDCIFRTNKGSSNYGLMKINLENPSEDNRTVIVPGHEKDVMTWAMAINNDSMVVCYIHDVKNTLELRSMNDGSLIKNFPLDVGTIIGCSGERHHSEFFFKFESFLTPGRIFHVDLTQKEIEAKIFKEIHLEGFDASKFTTKQIFYQSKDGTKVPMFIVHKKDIEYNGDSPCLLYGYGGFNISVQPTFSVMRVLFMHFVDGIVAVPNIRGGGEYGRDWHNAGRLEKKQNVFDDFHAAAEFLIANKYTNSSKIAIQGGSNGGLLVAACANQRPELYGASIAQCGVLDMLRFHKFTIGYAWVQDFGSSDTKEDFEFLIKYSPLHNVKFPEGNGNNVQYPAILLTTADHDDRVVPPHSFKLISQLQHVIGQNPKQQNPLLIRIETNAGHGSGKPTTKIIEECLDMLSFMIQSLKLKVKI